MIVDKCAVTFMIGLHYVCKLLLHHRLIEVRWIYTDCFKVTALGRDIEIKIDPRLICLDRANWWIWWIWWLFQSRIVILFHCTATTCCTIHLIVLVTLHELSGPARSRPKMLPNVWVQIQVLILHVNHTVKDYMPLRLCQHCFWISAAPSLAICSSKFFNGLLTALVLALEIHCKRL